MNEIPVFSTKKKALAASCWKFGKREIERVIMLRKYPC